MLAAHRRRDFLNVKGGDDFLHFMVKGGKVRRLCATIHFAHEILFGNIDKQCCFTNRTGSHRSENSRMTVDLEVTVHNRVVWGYPYMQFGIPIHDVRVPSPSIGFVP